MIGRQISGKPIDYAILQMQFSEKRASKRIQNMLALAKQHAINYKNLDPSKLIVCVYISLHNQPENAPSPIAPVYMRQSS